MSVMRAAKFDSPSCFPSILRFLCTSFYLSLGLREDSILGFEAHDTQPGLNRITVLPFTLV